jgi:hypothetical protein
MCDYTEKLKKLREAKQKESELVNEGREMVINGAILNCPYAQMPGNLIVTSNSLKLQDQLWATEGDDENMANLQFPGICGHPKFANQTPPPCMAVINLIGGWQNVGTTIVQEQKVLIKNSYIMCDPTPNVRIMPPIIETPVLEVEKSEEEAKGEILRVYISNYQELYEESSGI